MALTGTVSRWFNRKGYGFINVMNSDSEHVGNDIFVHLSGINVKNDGYKCLYPGEYVSFDLDTNKDGKPVCVNVTGVMGGSLLVEHPEFRFKYFQKNRSNEDANRENTDSRTNDDSSVPDDMEPEPEPEQ
jgi:cold shock CspA family protein|tara:strand:- start:126 stop:515 length:390 start_codon:yes stop_codon:yes gene_type:complete